jgi:5'-deoxynucleotidase YfbR-like HD superfamily hydrolase
VQRWHTRPTHRSQNVAEHTWQVMRLYIEMFGVPSSHVLMSVMYHDAAELVTGDVPFSAKRFGETGSDLKKVLTRLEHEASIVMELPTHNSVTALDAARLKICDLLDMVEFAREAQLAGDHRLDDVYDGLREIVRHMVRDLDQEDRDAVLEKIVEIAKWT